ncbi:hypothetical protein [Limnospira fusiformis]
MLYISVWRRSLLFTPITQILCYHRRSPADNYSKTPYSKGFARL